MGKRALTLNDKINIRGACETKGLTGLVGLDVPHALHLIYTLYGVPLSHFLDFSPTSWRKSSALKE